MSDTIFGHVYYDVIMPNHQWVRDLGHRLVFEGPPKVPLEERKSETRIPPHRLKADSGTLQSPVLLNSPICDIARTF